jgi:hypothetical protein
VGIGSLLHSAGMDPRDLMQQALVWRARGVLPQCRCQRSVLLHSFWCAANYWSTYMIGCVVDSFFNTCTQMIVWQGCISAGGSIQVTLVGPR